MNVPDRTAPFADKVAYYKSQHSSSGVLKTHLFGIPIVAMSLPLLFARPRVGIPMFAGGWAVQIAGHLVFEHNSPALKEGPLTYQLAGLAVWAEEVGEIVARRHQKRDGQPGNGAAAAPAASAAAQTNESDRPVSTPQA
jgi:uncharacterized membrane protein YGL010W